MELEAAVLRSVVFNLERIWWSDSRSRLSKEPIETGFLLHRRHERLIQQALRRLFYEIQCTIKLVQMY